MRGEGKYISALLLFGLNLGVVGLCDDKAAAGDLRDKKKCGDFSACEDCVRCKSECSWCVIGGLCTRFCSSVYDCTDDGCAKDPADFKCMTMQDANFAMTDFDLAGGINIKVKEKKVKTGVTEERKNRAYDPFIYVVKDKPDKKFGIKKKVYTGQLDNIDPPALGVPMLSNNGVGRLLR